MKIFIPTRGRVGQQKTLRNLPVDLWDQVIIVCPASEAVHHDREFPLVTILTQPERDMGISEKRKWIVEFSQQQGFNKIVMLDDDLRFAVRRTDDPTLFRPATDSDILHYFEELKHLLSEDIPHAGFSARGGGIGNAAQKGGWQEAKRMMYVLGYHVPTVLRHAEFGRLPTHEDIDVCLQLLTKGFPNMVNFSIAVDQKFGSPGGCSDERLIEQSNLDCYQLAVWFMDFVRVEEKAYNSSTPRVEVVCQWMKALKHGLLDREQREQALRDGN